jgi:hypothetical protein
MTFTEWLASTFGTSVIIIGLIAAFKEMILNHVAESVKHKYDKELETHINELRHKSELTLKDIEIKANERAIKIGGVFPSQKEVIENTYERIYRLRVALEEFSVSVFNIDPKAKGQVVADAFKEFEVYYYPKAIYLPQDVVSHISALIRAAHNLTGHLKHLSQLNVGQQVAGPSNEVTIKIQNILKEKPQLEKEFGECFLTVINRFQSIIGINAESK